MQKEGQIRIPAGCAISGIISKEGKLINGSSIVRSIAAGRPDAEDEALCRQFAADVMAKLDNPTSVNVPGNDPYVELKPSAFHPAADENCIKCGVCAEQCPVEAISEGDGKYEINPDVCVSCGSCAEQCPVEAIEEV